MPKKSPKGSQNVTIQKSEDNDKSLEFCEGKDLPGGAEILKNLNDDKGPIHSIVFCY